MKTVTYNDYQASVEYEDGRLFVKVLHIDDLLIGECNAASDAPAVLKELVDEYIADCAEAGREPTRQFKGTFNVRVGCDLHRKAAIAAASEGVTLNSWVQSSLEEKLECGKLSDRIEGVVSSKREALAPLIFAHQWTSLFSEDFLGVARVKKIRFEGAEEDRSDDGEIFKQIIQKRYLHA